MIRGALVVALLLAGSAAASAEEVERSVLEVAPSGAPITRLAIDNPIGDVRVEGHDGPGLKIIATKRAPDAATLERLRVSLVPDPSGAMRLVTAVDPAREARPVSRDQVRIDLVIHAPRAAWVDGRTGAGQLELRDMDGGAELDAGTGAIRVHNVSGAVIARAVDAPVTLQAIFGVVDATTLRGEVHLDTIRGDRASALVHQGRIDARRVRSRDIELRATTGDVRLRGEAMPGGTVRVAAVHGRIDVALRGAAVVRARAPMVTLPGAVADGIWQVARMGGGGGATVELVAREGAVVFAITQRLE